MSDLRYLRLLQRDFPTISSVTTEIINLEAILHLPKPTEHFLADLHGENEAFQHAIRTSSGNIRRKVEENFLGELSTEEINALCTLIYYPEERLKQVRNTMNRAERTAYYRQTLQRLLPVCRSVSHKYTRSKVRKALPAEYAYIIEELLHESVGDRDKVAYFNVIIDTIIETHRSRNFIRALRTGETPYFDVYKSVLISEMAILGWRSALSGGVRFDIPDLRSEAERKRWENDSFSPFPKQDSGEKATMPCSTRSIPTDYYAKTHTGNAGAEAFTMEADAKSGKEAK